MAADFTFLKKIARPGFSLFASRSSRVAGIHIGTFSTKVVQLRYEAERAILETYGELLNEKYLGAGGSGAGSGEGVLHRVDEDISSLLADLLRESNVSTREVVFAIPTTAAFITTISFPKALESEIPQAIKYEARKYVPIPIAEVVLEWTVLEEAEARDDIRVLLVAVPREVVEKFKRVGEITKLTIRALEVEPFSVARSLIGHESTPTLILDFGHQTSSLIFVDRGFVRMVSAISHGSHELTRALERGLGVGLARAETSKREVGLSERIEEQEITSVIVPLLDTLFAEFGRLVSLYTRRAQRRTQKIILPGGGAHLKGIVEYTVSKLGLETTRGNPFARVVTPPFMQPILNQVGPNLSVATGAALRGLSAR